MNQIIKSLVSRNDEMNKVHWTVVVCIAICCFECGCKWWMNGKGGELAPTDVDVSPKELKIRPHKVEPTDVPIRIKPEVVQPLPKSGPDPKAKPSTEAVPSAPDFSTIHVPASDRTLDMLLGRRYAVRFD